MIEFTAPGWTASWLNAWLAAIGVTVLCPDVTLRWDDDGVPRAVFASSQTDDLWGAVAAALPSGEDLETFAIARTAPGLAQPFDRNVTAQAFAERSTYARATGDLTLGSSVTDLTVDRRTRERSIEHSPFDPSAPRGVTLWERLVACRDGCGDDLPSAIAASAEGAPRHIGANGLGFDYRRILPATDPARSIRTDPVVEILAFFGLHLFPVRGDGRRPLTRGWTGPHTHRGSFTWPAWTTALAVAGIDALLDRFWAGRAQREVAVAYSVVPYQPLGQMDATRGYGSEVLR